MKTIVIIGGGLSGAITAVNLMRQSKTELILFIVEKSPNEIGRGLAYSTTNRHHLLNVPAGKMSCLYDDPSHLMSFLDERKYNYTNTSFIPRQLYGEYVHHTFKQCCESYANLHKIEIVRTEATNISTIGTQQVVQLLNGNTISCDKVVLAIGNFEPSDPKLKDAHYTISRNYIKDPFNGEVIKKIPTDKEVLIIGTGLTAIDIILSLKENKHNAKITVISNHGYLPVQHQLGVTYADYCNELNDLHSSLELFKVIRKHMRLAEKTGIDYRAVIDVIRPSTQKIWRTLSVSEKKKFLDHLRHIWGVARHRMAKEVFIAVQEMLDAGLVTLRAGRLQKINLDKDKFHVVFNERKTKKEEQLRADYIVNCTGPESNYDKINSQLVKNLLKSGSIAKDNINYGIDASESGRIIGADKKESTSLTTLGPPMKGILWECTAVPEIKVQAYNLAKELLNA